MRRIQFLTLILGLAITGSAMGQAVPSPDISIANTVNASIAAATSLILPLAVGWLGSFMALQFVLTNFALLKSGAEIEAVFGKLIASLVWFGFCIYLLNEGPGFIKAVGGTIWNMFHAAIPSADWILGGTLAFLTLFLAALAIVGTSIMGNGNIGFAMLLVALVLTLVAIGLYLSVKILMLQIELGLIVALAPLSFSLLGLNALRDQGIAPLKSLIALAYRMILMGILCKAFTEILPVSFNLIKDLTWTVGSFGKSLEIVFSGFLAIPMIAFLVYKSDSIAASLAGGGSSLGAADVASAAAAGAGAGAAALSAAPAAANAFSKIPQSMSSVLGNMMRAGGGGPSALSNASPSGAGTTSANKPPATPAASIASRTSTPPFPTNKAGAPQPFDSGGRANDGETGRSAAPAQSAEDTKNADAFGQQATEEAAAQVHAQFNSAEGASQESAATSSASAGAPRTANTDRPQRGATGGTPAQRAPGGTRPMGAHPAPLPSYTGARAPVGTAPTRGDAGSAATSGGANLGTRQPAAIPSATSTQRSTPVGPLPTTGQGASIGGTATVPPRKTTRDHLHEANHQISTEKATTNISISTQHE